MNQEEKIAFIFPGQGESHSVGMGKDFYENFAIVRETFQEASDILGYDISKLIFEGPLEKLSETKYCQIAIYVVCVAVLRVIHQEYPDLKPHFCAGLSLGEYSAATAAGVISFQEGVKLVHARGTYMQKACKSHPSTMAVVLGMDEQKVAKVIDEMELKDQIWIANLNCPGQIVVSGTHAAIEKFVVVGKEAGAKRVLPLNVAGAFHSPLMKEAADEMSHLLDEMDVKEPKSAFLMNVIGKEEKNTNQIKNNLILQITHPVRWEDSITEMKNQNVTHFFEIGCGKVLSGLNKRMGVSDQTYCINSVESLELIKQKMQTTN